MRCLHLNRVGEQCRDQALEGHQLCAFHARILEDDELELRREPAFENSARRSRIPLIYRLAALALLLIFLFDAFGSLRSWLRW